jgi:hypothetical protein
MFIGLLFILDFVSRIFLFLACLLLVETLISSIIHLLKIKIEGFECSKRKILEDALLKSPGSLKRDREITRPLRTKAKLQESSKAIL